MHIVAPEDKSEQEKLLREKGLSFFGAIAASVSHELNNVNSIIEQTAGLLGDLLAGAELGRPIKEEQLQRVRDRIEKQTHRGTRIIKRMNTFAHSVDYPIAEIEMNALIENIISLCKRLANLKKVELEAEMQSDPLSINSSPFLIQQALFLVMRNYFISDLAGETISVVLEPDKEGIVIIIETAAAEEVEIEDLDYIKLVLNQIQGNISNQSNSEKTRIMLKFPDLSH
ncbi:MAG: hypothetical protein GF315_11695 [candidate division Zixibacteria bacterium]|nr:hypothetical protein [candidate division Zixibacteria bacterium]